MPPRRLARRPSPHSPPGSTTTSTTPTPAEPGAGPAARSRHSLRTLGHRVWWTIRDYAVRVWDNAGEDNIFFLAGGIAFNLLLVAVPFFLLLISGLGYLLGQNTAQSSSTLWLFAERLLPPHGEAGAATLHKLLDDIVRTRGRVGLYGLIGFVWFTTRLFGSLRTVLGEVFDIDERRSIVGGKIFDIEITIVSTALFIAYAALSAYLRLATTQGFALAVRLGIRTDVLGKLGFYAASVAVAAVIVLMFFGIYRFIPDRRVPWRSAMVAALFTSVLFEAAKYAFTAYLTSSNPGSLYTGTLYAIVIIVFWTYYASVVFILGGEVGQVHFLRRVRRRQRERLESR